MRALALAAFLGLASCGSVRFERAWEAAAAGVTGAGVEGAALAEAEPARERWEGRWSSDWNGHSGGLRGLLARVDEHHVHVWFLSTYASVLSFEHATLFHLEPGPEGAFVLSGSQDLGKLVGGVYRYEGTLDAREFRARYSAENGDHGVFELTRVE